MTIFIDKQKIKIIKKINFLKNDKIIILEIKYVKIIKKINLINL